MSLVIISLAVLDTFLRAIARIAKMMSTPPIASGMLAFTKGAKSEWDDTSFTSSRYKSTSMWAWRSLAVLLVMVRSSMR